MKKLFFIVLLVASSMSLYSQTEPEKIDEAHFNYQLMNKLILEKINAKREKLHLQIVSPDSILHLAAQNQADYEIKQDKLTHFQRKNKMGDPAKRVQYYHGNYFTAIAENTAMEFWGKQVMEKDKKLYTYTTYEELAEAFVNGWIHSPPHYQNLSNKIYNSSGIAVAIDAEQKKIFAVQVFGTK